MGSVPRTKRSALKKQASIADALFPKGRQRVLAVLFSNPGRTFYTNEIIAHAQSGNGAVQRELASLVEAGLVSATRIGNQKHFQANATSPVFSSLRDIVLKTSGLADVLRATLAALVPELQAAFVFGSVAHHDDRPTSDIDLMVISDTLAYASLFAALESGAGILGRAINPTLYSKAEFARRLHKKNAFITRVMAQPKIWIFGGIHDIAP